ncbi:MAG: purine-binding chemotaxis protein CheW [Gemmatimonadetes bacterium]|nr:purine-binding chemotaxis protein CheW [Gemmatimonadota bacterium]
MSGRPGIDDRPQEVLAARAQALARPPALEVPRDQLRLLTFSLSGERYAIELRHVVEVFRLSSLSPLPRAAAPTLGLTAWRGELLPVLDLRQILETPARGLDDLGFAIVLGEERAPIAVLADALDDILSTAPERVRPAPEGVAVHRDYVRGVTEDARLVLDGERLLETHR